MSKIFQVISVDFKNPLTGEVKKGQQFLGLAVFTAEELKSFRESKKTLGDMIKNIKIFEPEDPMKYAESDPNMKDLIEGLNQMKSELEEIQEED